MHLLAPLVIYIVHLSYEGDFLCYSGSMNIANRIENNRLPVNVVVVVVFPLFLIVV